LAAPLWKIVFYHVYSMLLNIGKMTETAGGYRCMACGLVFDTKDEADRHEEQHPGMVRKSATTGDTATL
jgi:hypothetical protein